MTDHIAIFSNSIPNATGAYELDLTLSNNFSAMWREMHIKTDVFCSGSVIMPDKAGRQINVAGWAEESNFGVRLYTPSGSDGINGTTDWEENVDELALQVGGHGSIQICSRLTECPTESTLVPNCRGFGQRFHLGHGW